MKVITKIAESVLFRTLVNKINELIDNNNELQTTLPNKLDKTDTILGVAYKGECAYADLPTSGQELGDYWQCTDGAKGYYVWTGTKWQHAEVLLMTKS